ncbi:unnamed protein product, partial [Ascophyllum nodosum]
STSLLEKPGLSLLQNWCFFCPQICSLSQQLRPLPCKGFLKKRLRLRVAIDVFP